MQHTTVKFSIKLFFMFFVGLVIFVFGYQVGFAQEEAPDRNTQPDVGLFSPLSQVSVMGAMPGEIIIQSRDVLVDFELLTQNFTPGDTLTLNLFEGVIFTAVFDKIEKVDDRLIWYGHLADIDFSLVIFVVSDGSLVGKVTSPQGFYQIKSDEGVQKIIQYNPGVFPKEEEPIPVETSTSRGKEARSGITAADDGTMVDVMVVYTADAAAALGDPEASITLAIAEANTSYSNSDINFRINLVHSAQITYTEIVTDSSSTYLSHLKGISDGNMDDVHTWRDTYHADHVVLITDSGGCGLGYLMTTVSSSFQDSAFSTVRDDCLTGNLTLPHEIGHNMGARHDWYVDDGTTPYSYAHGYINMVEEFRTVMAYANECNDESGSCPRLQYWSNPNKTYNGAAMGEPEGSGTGCVKGTSYNPDPHDDDCDADNHLTLNNNASTVAQFRDSEIVWTGNVDSDWNTAGNWEQVEFTSYESFEGTFPPTGWSKYETGDAADPGWAKTNLEYSAHSGDYHARHNDDNLTANAVAWLVMPQTSINISDVSLIFWENNNHMVDYNYHGVFVSTASCDPTDGHFIELAEYNQDVSSVWTERTLSLSAYLGESVCIAFKYIGDDGAEWYIDDVKIQGGNTIQRVPRTIDDVVIQSSPASGRYPEISSGTANAREFIVEADARVTMTNGTFNVFGNWDEQGTTAVFSGTGGTVVLSGALDQIIDMNTNSKVNNLEVGNGSTKAATVNSNLNVDGYFTVDPNATFNQGSNTVNIGGVTTISGTLNVNAGSIDLNGNLTIDSGATLDGGTGVINVVGNWMDDGNGFVWDTCTTIFDGTTQAIDKTTTSTLINEPFDEADGGGCGCSSAKLPSGWIREHSSGDGWLGGDLGYCTSGSAMKWETSSDAWLFTSGVSLQPNVTYQLSYNFRLGPTGDTQLISISIGNSQNSGSMTTQISSVTAANTTCTVQNDTFTVSSSGTYYLGIRAQNGSGSNRVTIDDFQLTAVQNPSFYDLNVISIVSPAKDMNVKNNLTVYSSSTLNLGSNNLAVDGTLTNNGTIKQTQEVSGTTDVSFFNTGSYGGVTLNAETKNLGDTTVEIRGNQDCTTTAGETVKRCFKITPENSTERDTTITFYFEDSELSGSPPNTCSSLDAYHWNGSSWEILTLDTSYGTSGRDCSSTPRSIRVKDVASFSEFVLKSSVPTAVILSSLSAGSGSNQFAVLAVIALSLTVSGGVTFWKRKTKQI